LKKNNQKRLRMSNVCVTFERPNKKTKKMTKKMTKQEASKKVKEMIKQDFGISFTELKKRNHENL
jgi:hypothetical protein